MTGSKNQVTPLPGGIILLKRVEKSMNKSCAKDDKIFTCLTNVGNKQALVANLTTLLFYAPKDFCSRIGRYRGDGSA